MNKNENLFFIPENEVREYALKQKIPFIKEKCPCAVESYRLDTRAFLNQFEKEKKNIVNNLEKVKKLLKGKSRKLEIKYCEKCGEPCRNIICKSCELLNQL